ALRVARERRPLEAEVVNVRRTPRGREQVVERFGTPFTVRSAMANDDAIAVAHDIRMCIGVEMELGAEDATRLGEQFRVGEMTDATAAAEDLHAHAEAVQRLSEFETDHAR